MSMNWALERLEAPVSLFTVVPAHTHTRNKHNRSSLCSRRSVGLVKQTMRTHNNACDERPAHAPSSCCTGLKAANMSSGTSLTNSPRKRLRLGWEGNTACISHSV